jgi:16S rRNA (uracil1498-N3)-methyltransferase
MKLSDVTDWASYCVRGEMGDWRLLAHPEGTDEMANVQRAASVKDRRIVAVGPEGGFTTDEVVLAIENGWQAVNLGPRILRVETAALVLSCHAIAN